MNRLSKKQIAELEDPFLCRECQQLGYCREASRKSSPAIRQLWDEDIPKELDNRTIADLVPLGARDENGKYAKEHIQRASDAFHQQDYETAMLHFRAVLEVNIRSANALIGLAVTAYFLKQYEEAARYMAYYEAENGWRITPVIREFIRLCAILPLAEKETGKNETLPRAVLSVHALPEETMSGFEATYPSKICP